jgi:dinuclear metal center YbgI/SA1388 family protein
MVKRDTITTFIYDTLGPELLAKAARVDSVPNSVQIRGAEDVEKIVFGVSASPEFVEQAIAGKAHYIIVHHGLHSGYIVNGRFDLYEHRLKLLFAHDVTLAGFHYALDAHPKLGNNAQIIEKLGAKLTDEPYFGEWGFVGEFESPVETGTLADKCAKLFAHDVFAVYAGPKMVKRIGVCSGGARPRGEAFEIIDKNIDLHLTGEISESGPYTAEEAGYNYFACGHYATEVFGVQALAAVVKRKFGTKLAVEFLDVPNTL